MSIQARKRFGASIVLIVVSAVVLVFLNLNWPGRAQTSGSSTVPFFHSPLFSDKVRPLVAVPEGDSETQALLEIAATRQTAIRSVQTRADKEALLVQIGDAEIEELENFIAAHPRSVWTPSLRVALGKCYRDRGRYTPALDHWEAAWEASKQATSQPGKAVADGALAHWTRLLASLGRAEKLTEIFAVNEERVFSVGRFAQMWARTREGFAQMQRVPGDSYKCGVLALNNLAFQLHGTNVQAIMDARSSTNGFSMEQLWGLADAHQLNLAPALREIGNEIAVPSLVHWRQNHYAAVIAKHGDKYEVIDPTFGGRQMMDAETLNTEASGYFMISSTAAPPGWRWLSRGEAAQIYGRGCPYAVCDYGDQICDGCCAVGQGGGPGTSGPGSGGSGPGGPPIIGGSCGSCSSLGMTTWRVSEPYLNLWLYDTPLAYQPALGPELSFKLSFKQRDESSYALGSPFSNVGTGWNGNLFSYIWAQYVIGGSSGPVEVSLPGGGTAHFEVDPNVAVTGGNYYNNLRLKTLRDGSGNPTGFELLYPDGRKLVYGYRNTQVLYSYFFLTAIVDPQGRQLTLDYDSDDASYVHVSSVTDGDGNATTLSYGDATYPNLVTSVSGVPGTVGLSYDENGQNLTNIQDVIGIASGFIYNDYYWPTQMVTPYGVTSFTYYDAGGGHDYSGIGRSMIITEPDAAKQIYSMFRLDPGIANFPTSYSGSVIPTGTPLGTLDTSDRNSRISFYWNRQQTTTLSTSDPLNFTWSDYRKSRQRRWLDGMRTLSSEQSPSPDGTSEGQITWFDHTGKGSSYSDGNQILPAVTARVMPDGSTWYEWFQRNAWGHPTNVIEKWVSAGNTLYRTNTFVFAANGIDMVAHTNAAGVLASSNIFNAYSQVTTNFDALGQPTVYSYNATTHLLTSISRPSGLVTTNIYDGNDRLQQTTDLPINGTRSYTWYDSGNVKTVTDERGLTVTNFWDGLNRLTGTRYADGTTTTNLFKIGTTSILDLTAAKDRLGNWTYFGYDSLRRKIAETNANSVITRYGYCDCGGMSYVTNAWNTPVQMVTWFEYDFQGNRIYTHYPDMTVTNWFDSLGRLITTGDAWGYRWFGHDNLSRLTSITNAYGAEQVTVYDVEDHPIYVTDANSVTITNTYDDLDRVRTRGYPDGGVERFGYSARGMIAYTNQLGYTNFYAYDEAGRKTFETNSNWEVIRYTNNAAGDLLALVDGKNQVTKWNYDEYGRVTNKLDQAGAEILRYTYDAGSRLASRWSAAKGTTYYTNDAVGNLTKINYPVSPDITLSYDWLNRVTNMVDAAGTTKYAYTAGGQLWTEDGPWSSDTVTNIYFSRLRTNLSLVQPAGAWTNGFAYDAAKRLTNVTSPAGAFGYTLGAAAAASPLPKKLLLPNTSYITNHYDNVARLLFTKLNNSSHTTLNKHEYLYNVGNQRTQQTFTDAATYGYTYDKIGQLKVADSSVASQDCGYTYDLAWNLNYRTNSAGVTTFSVNSKNELTSGPNGNYAYDANGNLTNYYSTYMTYAYDDENQLTSWEYIQTARTEYVYDGRGRLRVRKDYSWNGSSWSLSSETRYVYDGMRVIQERNGSGTPLVSYTRGSDLSGSLEGAGGIGGMLARSHGYSSGNWTAHNYYHADGNGNITYLVNSSQTLAGSYRYDPYGNTISMSGFWGSANKYRFSSKELTPGGSGSIYYYGYRFYDPNLQRWLNRDPLGDHRATLLLQVPSKSLVRAFAWGLKIEQLEGPNLFAFLANNPVSSIDPLGRDHYQEPCFTKPMTGENIGPMWEDLWNTIPPKWRGKICRASCWGAASLCSTLCAGPQAPACLVACAAGASLCSDACPP